MARFNIRDSAVYLARYVYMNVAKTTQSYKFARPFHGPYRIIHSRFNNIIIIFHYTCSYLHAFTHHTAEYRALYIATP